MFACLDVNAVDKLLYVCVCVCVCVCIYIHTYIKQFDLTLKTLTHMF